MKNILVAFVWLTFSVSFAFAQDERKNAAQSNPAELKRAAMKKLDSLVGRWQGAGWIQQGKERENFVGTETVQRKLDGLALLVEGNYKNKEGVVIHETLAVLSPDLKAKNYDFQTYLANGMSGEYEFKATESGWQWGYQFPGIVMRYIIKIDKDVWSETGEMSRDDGKTWLKIFEMSLKKVG